ncbi:MAG TPA: sigma-70 family RNA polymerase sigma factor [Planctomycetota bacterium]|nr:sigma-70 family RNA polymerase sigma factor [Planctomycetota bacterium]
MVEAIRSDGELLAEFTASGREAAFGELVRRHGPLVLGACRRLLGDAADAEDAAQAVFMVLARKAAALHGERSLAGWLHRVARHVSLRAREAAAVRRAREKEAGMVTERGRSGEDLWAAVRPELDRALDGLPDRYRTPLILHHMEGRTQEEVAALLGVPTGTLSAQLARGREMLRERLGSRGAVCSAALLAGLLANHSLEPLPGSFAISAAKAAALAAAGKAAAAGLVSAQAAAWTEGVLKAMFWMKVKLAAGIALGAAVVLGAGVPLTVRAVRAGEAARPAPPTFRGEEPVQPDPAGKKLLTDEEMEKLAAEAVAALKPDEKANMWLRGKPFKPTMSALGSKNPHLGEQKIEHPLKDQRFWCVLLYHTTAVPVRHYLCVDRTGLVTYPFKVNESRGEQFGKMVAAEDRSKWQDQDYVNAAALYVHLSSPASEDGWKLCKSADDFLAIKFNMFPAIEAKRQEAAKQIEAPKVVKAGDKATVTFYAWHNIGGGLKQWTVEFGPEFKADSRELGRFGGGGYD